MITLAFAIQVAQELEPTFAAFGYHCGLTGGTLFRGESTKDVDLVLYPHDPKISLSPREITARLNATVATIPAVEDDAFGDSDTWFLAAPGDYVNRHVIIGTYKGVRVDLLIP